MTLRPRSRSEEFDAKAGGSIKFNFDRFRLSAELQWMDGRQVFVRPESRPSNVLKRDIITTEAEQDAATRAYVISAIARQALTREQIEAEIMEYQAYEQEQRAENQ